MQKAVRIWFYIMDYILFTQYCTIVSPWVLCSVHYAESYLNLILYNGLCFVHSILYNCFTMSTCSVHLCSTQFKTLPPHLLLLLHQGEKEEKTKRYSSNNNKRMTIKRKHVKKKEREKGGEWGGGGTRRRRQRKRRSVRKRAWQEKEEARERREEEEEEKKHKERRKRKKMHDLKLFEWTWTSKLLRCEKYLKKT